VLRDYAVLTTQSKTTIRNYKAAFFTSSTVADVQDYYAQAWADTLLATTSLIFTNDFTDNSKTVPEEDSKVSQSMMMDDVECLYVLLGICMFKLSGPLEAPKALICLRSMRYLLQPQYLNNKYFPQVGNAQHI
jgi:hypothetical protein